MFDAPFFIGDFLSASIDVESDWNFRIFDKRLVVVKTKTESNHKVAVLDVLTNLMFTIQVPETIPLEQLTPNHEYLFNLRVLTSKLVDDVDKDFVGFFKALDIDQSIEDFIKAYWVYPTKVRFQLEEIEET
jgi:hypothetical protein